ncbi:hypothetical protein BGX34_005834, partial [Mortierella sp. NVP85]
MEELQKQYLQRTYSGDITLSEWAKLGVKTTADQLDALWTGAVHDFLLKMGIKGTNVIDKFAHLSYADRMNIWNEASIQKAHQVNTEAQDATDTLECAIQSKRKMRQGDRSSKGREKRTK